MSEWDTATFEELMVLDVDAVPVDPAQEYDIVGVLNRGRGLLFREAMAGSETSYKTLNRIAANQVVYSRLKAFEGAITVAPDGLHEVYASQEFPTFTCGPSLLPAYFRLLTTTGRLWDRLQNLSTGMGGRRERVKPADFLTIRIDVPSLPEQRRIVDVMFVVDAQIEAQAEEVGRIRGVLRALRRDIGDLGEKVPLRALAEPGGIQIGPFGSQLHAYEYTDGPHGVPVVMPQDLVDGEIVTAKIMRVPPAVAERLSRHALQPADILFPRRGDLTKRALVKMDQAGWLCGTGCLRFRASDQAIAPLLAEALAGDETSDWLVEHAVGTTMLNLNTEILSKLPVADVSRHPELARAAIAMLDGIRVKGDELAHLGTFRSTLLTALLDQEIEIPASYDTVLDKVG